MKLFSQIKQLGSHTYYGNDPLFFGTQTGKGFIWEKRFAAYIGGVHDVFSRNGVDVSKDGVNYDVKVCEAYKTPKGGVQWVFNRNRPKDNIHYYACIALKEGIPDRLLVIPTECFGKRGITIGTFSRYNRFSMPAEGL